MGMEVLKKLCYATCSLTNSSTPHDSSYGSPIYNEYRATCEILKTNIIWLVADWKKCWNLEELDLYDAYYYTYSANTHEL